MVAHDSERPGPEYVCRGLPGVEGEGPVGFCECSPGVSGASESEKAGCLGQVAVGLWLRVSISGSGSGVKCLVAEIGHY